MVRKLILPVIVLLALGFLWLQSYLRATPVDVATVTRGPIREVVEEEGRTRVVERFVVSAPVEGRLQRVALDAGARVEKGDLLAEIDPLPLRSRVEETEAQARALAEQMEGVETKKPKEEEIESARILEQKAQESVAVAETELAEARAAWEEAQRNLESTRALARQQSVPPRELDTAVAAEQQAAERVKGQEVRVRIQGLETSLARLSREILQARLRDYDWEKRAYAEQIDAVNASLARLRDDLKRTEIRAPVAGTVLVRHLESEQMVTAGAPILELGDLSRLEVEADFLSEDAVRMREGMPAEIFGRALGESTRDAVVSNVHPSAFTKISSLGVEQQRVHVVVSLDAEGLGLGDRYRVEVRVVLAEKPDVLRVPEGALFREAEDWYAFVVEGGKARRVRVRTGLRDKKEREILEGLAADARVILHPDASIHDGARVEPLGGA